VEGSCEYINVPSVSIKCWEILEWLHNWRLVKKGSAPWVSKLVKYIVTDRGLHTLIASGLLQLNQTLSINFTE
jgi:hypothetical protein